MKAVPKPILKNASNYDQNQGLSVAPMSSKYFLIQKIYNLIPSNQLKSSGMNAYPRYRSSTPKKTVSDLGFNFVVSK